jgi:hypothetical protein
LNIERKQQKLDKTLQEIELLNRYDKRNMQISKMLEKDIYIKKLIKAGKLFDQVDILDTYDESAVLNLLNEHKEKIIIIGGKKNGID